MGRPELAGSCRPIVLQQIEPKHERVGFVVWILSWRRPVCRRDHLDNNRMGFCCNDIEMSNAAPRYARYVILQIIDIIGTAGGIRTTDLLIHSKFLASAGVRHPPTRSAADPQISLVSWHLF
jgi:hypothetical protein